MSRPLDAISCHAQSDTPIAPAAGDHSSSESTANPRPSNTEPRDGLRPVARVTLKDVARAACVHYTTVSLSLRHSPKIARATRERVCRTARELGYVPDEVSAALTACRLPCRVPIAPRRLAYLSSAATAADFFERTYNRDFFNGSRDCAWNHGYECDLVLLKDLPAREPDLSEFLREHSYQGVILGALDPLTPLPSFDWRRHRVVRIDSGSADIPVRSICNDQIFAIQIACRQLRRLGYRRVGMAIGREDEIALEGRYTGGFFSAMSDVSSGDRIPPLYFPFGARSPEAIPLLKQWVLQHRLEAVMCNWFTIDDMLGQCGFRIPNDIACACLNLDPLRSIDTGVTQNHRIVGERAAEELLIELKCAPPAPASSPAGIFIRGAWHDGHTAPGVAV
ncbi:HTH-type transcriptional repressor PurR [mine drainage metagenome]|uniref:HTH-type transcriptional repressor PurR n=1 Tax=mine drainage metagenome TaxID=410659 RepID=A0A1J5R282_9ZZZZ